MSGYYKILIGIAGAAYLISPFDLIPEALIPMLGWFDDFVVIGLILYYFKNGTLPNTFYRQDKSRTDGRDTGSQFSRNRDFQGRGGDESAGFGGRKQSNRAGLSPYQILGVEENATQEEIAAAYRKRVKEYHPDKVAHLGKEFQELAGKRFIDIREAYNKLKKTA
ncbi:MAG: DnaJ domain-containing protein [Desulfamplus sp.]|nr:DnaJ domain-containing protein [Desulfamplus sp.]